MNIKNTFLALTSKTYPYGYEEELESFLPKGYYKGKDRIIYVMKYTDKGTSLVPVKHTYNNQFVKK